MDQFQLNGTSDFYKLFSKACDEATLYELDQMADAYYDTLCDFISFLHIQDETTMMYKTGQKLIELCKMTNAMASIEQDAAQR